MKLNTIYNEDCLEGMKRIPDERVDLIVTDPPYGIEYQTFRTNSRKIKNDDTLSWVDEFAYQSSRVLKHSNHLYCFVDAETSADFIIAFRKHGFKIRNLLTIPRGVKGNGGDRIFQQQFEFCIFATLGSKAEGEKIQPNRDTQAVGYVLKRQKIQTKRMVIQAARQLALD